MKKLLSGLFSTVLFLSLSTLAAQDKPKITIEDFKKEHDKLKEDLATLEIEPINDEKIKKLITFFVQKEFPDVAESTRNIIWDSYQTFINNTSRYHYHTFICQIKVKDDSRLKYLEVKYFPEGTGTVKTDYKWRDIDEDDPAREPIQEFFTDEEWFEFKRAKKKRMKELGLPYEFKEN